MTTRNNLAALLEFIGASGTGAPALPQKLAMLAQYRKRRDSDDNGIDHALVESLSAARELAHTQQDTIRKLGEHIDTLTAEPLHPALFVQAVPTPHGRLAEVECGGHRLVAAGPGVELDQLIAGTDVFLNNERNVIIAVSTQGLHRLGETARVVECLDEARLLVTQHDTDFVVLATDAVGATRTGDTVRLHRAAMLALEKMQVEDTLGVIEDIADTDATDIAGYDVPDIVAQFTRSVVHPDIAARYGLGGNSSLLLYGPPGCGKTTTMRAIASQMSRLAGKRCRVITVNGAELEDSLVGSTQKKIKRVFRNANEHDGPAIIFLDEADAIGRIRGDVSGHLSDKFLATWLSQMDGMVARNQVAIVAATNRKDLLDPAFRERLSDMEVQVTRPRREAAREIFQIHLPPERPYRPNGADAAATREELVWLGVTRLYAPNADNRIAEIRFRDNSSRSVTAADLVSGRLIKQICDSAGKRAFAREIDGGAAGIGTEDMEAALEETLARLRRDLSRHNLDSYLDDLPPGIDIVSVEAQVSRNPHHYRLVEGSAA